MLLWQGQLVSQIGSQAFLIAAMYWIMETTGSASLTGMLMMAASLPTILLGPVGGTLADWYSRRTIIVVSDLLSGICVLTLGILFFVNAPVNSLVIAMFSAVILLGIIKAFFQPAIIAAIPDLVPANKLAAANSLTGFSTQASAFLGQGFGGILYRFLGAGTLFLADGDLNKDREDDKNPTAGITRMEYSDEEIIRAFTGFTCIKRGTYEAGLRGFFFQKWGDVIE